MIRNLLVLLCCSFVLCGCGLTKKDLGLSRSVPDENVVGTRQPLDLPPDFNVLPE